MAALTQPQPDRAVAATLHSPHGKAVAPAGDRTDHPLQHAVDKRPAEHDHNAERRLGARYSQSLLSGQRATGLPAKEPNQEPTQADVRVSGLTGAIQIAGSNRPSRLLSCHENLSSHTKDR